MGSIPIRCTSKWLKVETYENNLITTIKKKLKQSMSKINPNDYEVEDSRPQSKKVKMSSGKKVRKMKRDWL